MKHGSLFSGIGGFDLASEWMGWENLFHCEINEFGQKILKYYWPKAVSYGDITKTDFTIWRGKIDILTGGFPCQPYSHAGKRKGKDDERHLWPEMLRSIREIKPIYIVGENVYGLINWNGGLVFDEVQNDLEAEGYQVQPILLPAASINAPHKRDRVWFVAHSYDNRESRTPKENEGSSRKEWLQKWNKIQQLNKSNGLREFFTNSSSCGRIQNNKEQQTGKFKQDISGWRKFPIETPICNGDDGLSERLDSITFPKWRSESIKAGGNAIVPQVAYEIFKVIEKLESTPLELQG